MWFPFWPTDRLRRGNGAPLPDHPLVTAGHDGRRRSIVAADRAAQELRLRPGMALAHARAAVPGLLVAEADPAGDADALHRLAWWCQRWTPFVAPEAPDGLWLDATGSAHLFGGEAALLDEMLRCFSEGGMHARAAMAGTPGAAYAVARHAGNRVVPPGSEARALAGLPITALRLSPDTVLTLRRLGLERVSDLAAVPRGVLARRFGPEVAGRLDQALGRVAEPITPLVPLKALGHREAFAEPLLTAEALYVAIDRLVKPVCDAMEQAGQGARRLDLLFHRVDGANQAIRIGTARPSRAPRHLARLLGERLGEVDPGLGIEAMHLLVRLAEPLEWQQAGDALDGAAIDLSPLVDRLANRLGPDRVYRAAPADSDVPERAMRRMPALAQVCGTWPAALPAPVRLLDPPHPVDAGLVALPDQPPRSFVWQRRRHQVRHADGPARVHGEWWRRDRELVAVRDYFRIEDDEGGRFWLFRQGNGTDPATGGLRWFVHGLF